MTGLHSWRVLRVALTFLLVAHAGSSHAETLVSFDAPGATDTLAVRVNAFGVVVGNYVDASAKSHGFVRYPGGAFATVDAATDLTDARTFATGINWAGQVIGYVTGVSMGAFAQRGFLRDPIGRITSLEVPGALATVPSSINAEGWVAGTYRMTLGSALRGFLHRPGHPLVTFELPGISASVIGVDATGRVFGNWTDERGRMHGFVRGLDATFTSFDEPEVGTVPIFCSHCSGTLLGGVNAFGRLVGSYGGATAVHGFLRTPDGNFATIDPPGAFSTSPVAINLQGQVAGTYRNGDSKSVAYVMQPGGSVRLLDVFGSAVVTVGDINVRSEVVGSYMDESFKRHGFLWRM